MESDEYEGVAIGIDPTPEPEPHHGVWPKGSGLERDRALKLAARQQRRSHMESGSK